MVAIDEIVRQFAKNHLLNKKQVKSTAEEFIPAVENGPIFSRFQVVAILNARFFILLKGSGPALKRKKSEHFIYDIDAKYCRTAEQKSHSTIVAFFRVEEFLILGYVFPVVPAI